MKKKGDCIFNLRNGILRIEEIIRIEEITRFKKKKTEKRKTGEGGSLLENEKKLGCSDRENALVKSKTTQLS